MVVGQRPDRKRLIEALDYDPETGIFRWRIRAGRRAAPGAIAGSRRANGYWRIRFEGREYSAHRLAWFFMTGEWPFAIDHRDLNGFNNSFENLRAATTSQNAANQPGRGETPKGVTFIRQTGRFRAQIKANGKSIHLGIFDTPQEANAAYAVAARKLFGEFARAA